MHKSYATTVPHGMYKPSTSVACRQCWVDTTPHCPHFPITDNLCHMAWKRCFRVWTQACTSSVTYWYPLSLETLPRCLNSVLRSGYGAEPLLAWLLQGTLLLAAHLGKSEGGRALTPPRSAPSAPSSRLHALSEESACVEGRVQLPAPTYADLILASVAEIPSVLFCAFVANNWGRKVGRVRSVGAQDKDRLWPCSTKNRLCTLASS